MYASLTVSSLCRAPVFSHSRAARSRRQKNRNAMLPLQPENFRLDGCPGKLYGLVLRASRRFQPFAHLAIFTTGTARYFGLPSRKRERVPEPPQSVTFFILFAGAPPGAGSLACWGDYSCA